MSQPAAAPDIKSAADVEPELGRAVRDLILALADSKRILGIRYADWVLGAPELEATIAASSLAQDEWGHSRLLYALLKDFGDDPGHIEHGREPAEYRSLEALDQPLDTWPELVVINAVADTALTTQLEALTHSRYAPLRQRVRKQLEEERFHFGHGAAWVRRLGRAGEGTRTALKEALAVYWPPVLHWFGPDDYGAELKEAGFAAATGGELRKRLVERLNPVLEESGAEAPSIELDFSSWDPTSRRANPSGPDADAVARARGDRNREFLMD